MAHDEGFEALFRGIRTHRPPTFIKYPSSKKAALSVLNAVKPAVPPDLELFREGIWPGHGLIIPLADKLRPHGQGGQGHCQQQDACFHELTSEIPLQP